MLVASESSAVKQARKAALAVFVCATWTSERCRFVSEPWVRKNSPARFQGCRRVPQSPVWSGRFRLISRARGEEAMVSRHTRELARSNESRATLESRNGRGLGQSSSPRHRLDQQATEAQALKRADSDQSEIQEGSCQMAVSDARGLGVLSCPRVVPVHIALFRQPREQKRISRPSLQGAAKAAVTEQLRQAQECSLARVQGCSLAPARQANEETVWARSHEGVVSSKRQCLGLARGGVGGIILMVCKGSRSASVFHRASGRVAESPHETWAPKSTLAFQLLTCSQKMRRKLGRE